MWRKKRRKKIQNLGIPKNKCLTLGLGVVIAMEARKDSRKEQRFMGVGYLGKEERIWGSRWREYY